MPLLPKLRRVGNAPSISSTTSENMITTTSDAVKFLFPENPTLLRDHIAAHQTGTTFRNAIITPVVKYDPGKAEDTFKAMALNNEVVNIDLPLTRDVSKLTQTTHTYKLASFANVLKGKNMFNVQAVLIRFVPLQFTFNEAVPVTISLKDKGFSGDHVHPSVEFNKTLTARVTLGLNYPCLVENLSDLELEITTGSTGMAKGRPWATIEMHVIGKASNKGVATGITPSNVCYELPNDLFQVLSSDPRTFRAVLHQDDLDLLKGIITDVAGSRRDFDIAKTHDVKILPKTPMAFELPESSASNISEGDKTVTIPRPSSSEIEGAIELMSSLGYDVTRRDEVGIPHISLPKRLQSTSSRPTMSPPTITDFTLVSTLRALLPNMEIDENIRSPIDINPAIQNGLVPLSRRNVFVRISESESENNKISLYPFPGGMPIPWGTFASLLQDVEFVNKISSATI